MSEFQYYEFQKIDGALTDQEQKEISSLSSRCNLQGNTAVFTYNFGSFKHCPEIVLEQYFDAMLYAANWGTKYLLFKFPAHLIDLDNIKPYICKDIVEIEHKDNMVIIRIMYSTEDYWGYLDEWKVSDMLTKMTKLREDIVMRDYRVLYLAIAADEYCDDILGELPVPDNLQSLTPELNAFIEFFEIPDTKVSKISLRSSNRGVEYAGLDDLNIDEMKYYLQALINDTPFLKQELLLRLQHKEVTYDADQPNRVIFTFDKN